MDEADTLTKIEDKTTERKWELLVGAISRQKVVVFGKAARFYILGPFPSRTCFPALRR
jgi:hypothetical protein